MEKQKAHRSGFVNIIGKPNVGKSTLMNALVGERMSIITNKPQTTRHRIIGIVNDDDYQIVFSDTPGFIKDPSYKMQENMNKFVQGSFKDGDVMLLVVDATDTFDSENPLFTKIQGIKVPFYLVLNKVDLVTHDKVVLLINEWSSRANFKEIIPISALEKEGTEYLFEKILEDTPEGPVYYEKDQFTDRPERFFVSEIIREGILEHYYQEIPYSCEVEVDEFKIDPDPVRNLVRINATIYVSRKSQKYILIGSKGSAIKALGIQSRRGIERFLGKKVHLELYVRVRDNWRDDDQQLKRFGYQG